MCRSVVGNTARLVGKTRALGDECLAELQAVFDASGYCDFARSGTPSCNQVLGQVSAPVTHGSVPVGEICDFDSDCAAGTNGETSCTFDLSTTDFTRRCQEQIPGGKAGSTPCVGTSIMGGLASGGTTFVASGVTCDYADGICDPAP
jgi:hypothetical protein